MTLSTDIALLMGFGVGFCVQFLHGKARHAEARHRIEVLEQQVDALQQELQSMIEAETRRKDAVATEHHAMAANA